MKVEIVKGNIINQDVEVIVNSWNRNIIPWWLLLPQGVSGAIKKNAGILPFKEVAKCGPIPLGEAHLTSAGRLNYKGIIHVAGINMFWFANKYSITKSVENAMKIVNQQKFKSVAFPLIGAGSGNKSTQFSQDIMLETFETISSDAEVRLIKYDKKK